ncbi:MAG: sulfatase-like hydrolase/transferase, partial [Bacteroidales bacterium]|nr:sulfatase-like hydrolase/transferase [Bacteroidales bacterium]
MRKKTIIDSFILTGAALTAASCGQDGKTPAKQPNVVFILADDLGWGDLSCYGQELFQTPNIDALAQSG